MAAFFKYRKPEAGAVEVSSPLRKNELYRPTSSSGGLLLLMRGRSFRKGGAFVPLYLI